MLNFVCRDPTWSLSTQVTLWYCFGDFPKSPFWSSILHPWYLTEKASFMSVLKPGNSNCFLHPEIFIECLQEVPHVSGSWDTEWGPGLSPDLGSFGTDGVKVIRKKLTWTSRCWWTVKQAKHGNYTVLGRLTAWRQLWDISQLRVFRKIFLA
jgi:hypothetical protein